MRSIQDLTSIYDTYCSGVRCFPTKLNLVCHKESKLIILTRSENHRQKQHTLTDLYRRNRWLQHIILSMKF